MHVLDHGLVGELESRQAALPQPNHKPCGSASGQAAYGSWLGLGGFFFTLDSASHSLQVLSADAVRNFLLHPQKQATKLL